MRIYNLLFALLITTVLSAQSAIQSETQTAATSATESVIDFSKLKYRVETNYSQQFRTGKHTVTSPYHVIKAGLNVELPFEYGLAVETGLHYNYAFGQRNQLYAHSDTASFKYNGHILDIPIRGSFTFPVVWGIKMFAFAGPVINIGLIHKDVVNFTGKEIDPPATHPLDYPQSGTYNSYENDLRRFNLQFGTGGGLQWRNYRVKSGYEWGVNSISKQKAYPQRQRGWHVAFEYQF